MSLFKPRQVVSILELLILISTISPHPHVTLMGNRLKRETLRTDAILDGDMSKPETGRLADRMA